MVSTRELKQFILPIEMPHVEIDNVHFDRRALVVRVRLFEQEPENVFGMIQVIFENPVGYRVLDEEEIDHPPCRTVDFRRAIVHRVNGDGWLKREPYFEHLYLPEWVGEYIVVSDNICVSVISYAKPTWAPTTYVKDKPAGVGHLIQDTEVCSF